MAQCLEVVVLLDLLALLEQVEQALLEHPEHLAQQELLD
jgi:hypothetical protein